VVFPGNLNRAAHHRGDHAQQCPLLGVKRTSQSIEQCLLLAQSGHLSASRATQAQTTKPQDTLEMRKQHLNALSVLA
jgi:hypothetical protein